MGSSFLTRKGMADFIKRVRLRNSKERLDDWIEVAPPCAAVGGPTSDGCPLDQASCNYSEFTHTRTGLQRVFSVEKNATTYTVYNQNHKKKHLTHGYVH